MRKIALSSKKYPGLFAIVDDEDFEKSNQYNWYVVKVPNSDLYYVRRMTSTSNGKREVVYLHRFLLGVTDPKIKVDHKDGNGLNNSIKENLRIATSSENGRNQKLNKNNKTGAKGVFWNKNANKFSANISILGKRYHLGYFNTVEEAKNAYNFKAKECFGQFYRELK